MATPAPVVRCAVALVNEATEVASDSRWEAERADRR